MRPHKVSLATGYALLLAPLLMISSCGSPPGEGARITEIQKANLIEITTGEKIKLLGVDEIIFPDQAREMTDEAVQFTRDRLEGRLIVIQRSRVPRDAEQAGMEDVILAYVYIGNSLFNAEVIREGYGKVAEQETFDRKEEFERLEKEARRNKRGLWARAEP